LWIVRLEARDPPQDFIRPARAEGLLPGRILFRHGLKNAAIPLVTLLGMDFGWAC
jgi:ABC-type dipeptide/oligopeptide/nickel transport system permease component